MRDKVLQKIFPAFGTVNMVTLYGNFDPDIAEEVKERALQLHRRFSFFEPGSDIFRINQQAGIKPVAVHQDAFFVLFRALAYGKETQGAFDITSGPMYRLWRNTIRSAKIGYHRMSQANRAFRFDIG